jgi:hypothetical protein
MLNHQGHHRLNVNFMLLSLCISTQVAVNLLFCEFTAICCIKLPTFICYNYYAGVIGYELQTVLFFVSSRFVVPEL